MWPSLVLSAWLQRRFFAVAEVGLREHPFPSEGKEMSIKIKEWLRRLGIDTTHEEREEIDREIEERTGQYCDKGAELLSEAEFLAIVNSVRRKRRKQISEPLVA